MPGVWIGETAHGVALPYPTGGKLMYPGTRNGLVRGAGPRVVESPIVGLWRPRMACLGVLCEGGTIVLSIPKPVRGPVTIPRR